MAGYNHRQSLVRFIDDEDGYGFSEFRSNKHLRVVKPTSWRDLFRKYPPGKGIIKDRVYYNRRKNRIILSLHLRITASMTAILVKV